MEQEKIDKHLDYVENLIERNNNNSEKHRVAYGKVMYNKALYDVIGWIDEISNSVFALSAPENELKMLQQFKDKCNSLKLKQP